MYEHSITHAELHKLIDYSIHRQKENELPTILIILFQSFLKQYCQTCCRINSLYYDSK